MVRRGATVLACLVLTGIAAAEPKPRPVDIKPFKDTLVILKDADGGIYAVTNEKGGETHIFYGTGKVLHQALLEGGKGRSGDAWSVSVQAPRVEYPFAGQIDRQKNGTYRRVCGKQIAELAEVTGDAAKKIIDKSSFKTTQVIYRPYLLARDDAGVYYYVDMLRDEYGGHGHRVFVGKKGALKRVPLVDIASDSGGDVFATKTGDLRLVKTVDDTHNIKLTAQWIRGNKKTELIYLDLYMSQPLIYRDLGIYKYPGLICGNI